MTDYAPYPSASAHKLLLPQRDAQFAQSAATRDGNVAPYKPGCSAPPAATQPSQRRAGFLFWRAA